MESDCPLKQGVWITIIVYNFSLNKQADYYFYPNKYCIKV